MNKKLLALVFIILGITGLAEARIVNDCSECTNDEVCITTGSMGRKKGVVLKKCIQRYK